jgi:uncharacterized membrane protein required for colicin V production
MSLEPHGMSTLPGLLLAAASAPPRAVSYLEGFGWFDLFFVGMLIAGLLHGKKRGMSVELIPLFQWLLVVVIGSLYYDPVGRLIALSGLHILWSFIIGYVVIAIGVKIGFGVVQRMVGEKLIGSDLFGRMEFALGMLSGVLRHMCMMLAALAILNAPYRSYEETEASKKKWEADLGTKQVLLPGVSDVQNNVFYKSLFGRWVRAHFEDQLIAPTHPSLGLKNAPPPRRGTKVADKKAAPAKDATASETNDVNPEAESKAKSGADAKDSGKDSATKAPASDPKKK